MNQSNSKKGSLKPFCPHDALKYLHLLKELILQLLFPRACPICGELLKLPKGWLSLLSSEGSTSRCIHDAFLKSISACRSLFICPECYSSLSFVEEPVCRKCSKPLVFDDEYFCENCQKGNLYFDQGKALWIHDDAARKVVYDLKFQNNRDNADLIGFEMALRMKELVVCWKAEVFIPVPLHKKRLRERDFNQAQLIAEKTSFWLEKLFGITIPVDAGYLLRAENTKPQRILDVSARSQNVKDAFAIPSIKHYRSVILIDDIFTSGATLNACAKTIKAAGVQQVYFLTATVV